MLRRMFLFAAVAALIALPALGEETKDKKPDPKKQELKTVIVENAFTGDIKDTKKLPNEFRIVAELMAHKNATYKIENNQLKIGIKVADIRPGVELEKIQFDSDCPDNSQFTVESILTKRDAALKATTVAWTRHRHKSPGVPLRVVNIDNRGDNRRNYDVQLKILKVGFFPLRE